VKKNALKMNIYRFNCLIKKDEVFEQEMAKRQIDLQSELNIINQQTDEFETQSNTVKANENLIKKACKTPFCDGSLNVDGISST
jgi:hypothetical protein